MITLTKQAEDPQTTQLRNEVGNILVMLLLRNGAGINTESMTMMANLTIKTIGAIPIVVVQINI